MSWRLGVVVGFIVVVAMLTSLATPSWAADARRVQTKAPHACDLVTVMQLEQALGSAFVVSGGFVDNWESPPSRSELGDDS